MNDFLNSVKADLLDRQRLPYLIALCAALVAVLAYAMLGGSAGGGSLATTSPPPEPASTGGIAVSVAPSSADAAAETSSGASQGQTANRDFFKPLPSSEPAAATKSTTAASSTASTAATAASASTSAPSSSSSSSGPSTGSSGGGSSSHSAPAPSAPAKPTPPQPSYEVSLLFGVASPPPAVSQLTPHNNVKRGLQLPSSQVPLVTFSGWTTGGASATFTLSGEAILHGAGTCVPSPTQCTSIELKPGQAEQLEYVPTSGPVVTYELKLVSISQSHGTAATASAVHAPAHAARAHAHTARAQVRRTGLRRTHVHSSGHRRHRHHRDGS